MPTYYHRQLRPKVVGRAAAAAMHEGDPDLVERGFSVQATGQNPGEPASDAYAVGHLAHELEIPHDQFTEGAAVDYVENAVPVAQSFAGTGVEMGIGGWGEADNPSDFLDVTALIPRTTGDPATDPGFSQAVSKAAAERQWAVGELGSPSEGYLGSIPVGTRHGEPGQETGYTIDIGPESGWGRYMSALGTGQDVPHMDPLPVMAQLPINRPAPRQS